MAWRLAKSLIILRDQINGKWPNRSKSEDGTIGDSAHAARASDHNPDQFGVVRAIDFTHDPAYGFDSYQFADDLRQSRDPRIKYIISNRRIASATVSPWLWRPYDGANAHDRHCHISVVGSSLADDIKPWSVIEAIHAPASEIKSDVFNDDDRTVCSVLMISAPQSAPCCRYGSSLVRYFYPPARCLPETKSDAFGLLEHLINNPVPPFRGAISTPCPLAAHVARRPTWQLSSCSRGAPDRAHLTEASTRRRDQNSEAHRLLQ
jgi:hypothetical protein